MMEDKEKLKKEILDKLKLKKLKYLSTEDTFKFTCLLREWVFKNSHMATLDVQEKESMPIWKIFLDDPVLTTNLYSNFEIGTSCGGTNEYLAQIYRLFDIPATTYNFGIEKFKLTHVICVVDIGGKLILQDAYFNGFLSVENEPLDFLLLPFYEDKVNKIAFKSGREKHKYLLYINNGKLLKQRVRWTWSDFYSNFKSNYKNSGLVSKNFFHMLFYPLNYTPISYYREYYIVKYLQGLSFKYNTNFHFNKDIYLINSIFEKTKTFYKIANFFELNYKYFENKDIVIYGISSFGYYIYKLIIKYNLKLKGIVDGDENKQNYYIDNFKILSPEELNTLNPQIIFICSFSNDNIIIKKLSKILHDDEIELITLEKIVKCKILSKE